MLRLYPKLLLTTLLGLCILVFMWFGVPAFTSDRLLVNTGDRLANISSLQWLRRLPEETTCHNWKTGAITFIPKERPCPCRPANHIYFLKTHKCGSTTFAGLLIRFAYKYRLSFGQRSGTSLGWLGWPHSLLPTHVSPTYVRNLTRYITFDIPGKKANNSLIDIITLHTVYNQTTLNKVMPDDTVKVAIIREPFFTFQSAFDYVGFDHAKALDIKGPNPIKTYLESPTLKEKTIHGKHFQNFISTEFGFSNHSVNDPELVKEFIAYIDKHFRLVAITEYFKESLVLLKRMLCWKTEEIVFLHLNKNLDKKHQVKPKSGRNFTYLKTLHKRWSRADYIFYDNFNKTFWRKIRREGKQFQDELRDFEVILSQVTRFCRDGAKAVPPGDRLMVSKTRWHSAFNVTMLQCDQMQAGIYTNIRLYFDRDW